MFILEPSAHLAAAELQQDCFVFFVTKPSSVTKVEQQPDKPPYGVQTVVVADAADGMMKRMKLMNLRRSGDDGEVEERITATCTY
ncbi:hypothetical protein EYF80_001203 [Liparis tanakae]|uniref:Uncharacterized protein n=1 Tax=Liparis tanakae TaxID=230148 RepID=A0A4Z2JEI3_9TELE|nr:hypothetical protein EYF80_001203 [Liparis tanakae]